MLLLLVTGQRGQSIHLLNIVTMHLGDTSCVFNLTSHTKTSQPGQPASTITIQEFKQDCRICPIKTLREYLKRTDTIRGDEQQLFISFVKPHKSVSRDTISRWAKIVLQRSGIDTELFTSRSTRQPVFPKPSRRMYLWMKFYPRLVGVLLVHSRNSMTSPLWHVMTVWRLLY